MKRAIMAILVVLVMATAALSESLEEKYNRLAREGEVINAGCEKLSSPGQWRDATYGKKGQMSNDDAALLLGLVDNMAPMLSQKYGDLSVGRTTAGLGIGVQQGGGYKTFVSTYYKMSHLLDDTDFAKLVAVLASPAIVYNKTYAALPVVAANMPAEISPATLLSIEYGFWPKNLPATAGRPAAYKKLFAALFAGDERVAAAIVKGENVAIGMATVCQGAN